MKLVKQFSICVDCRILKSGIGVYITHILEQFAQSEVYKIFVLIKKQDRLYFNNNFHEIFFSAEIYTFSEQLEFVYKVPDCDVFWSPHFNIPVLSIKAKKRIVTIHDLNHLQPWFKNASAKDYVKSFIAGFLIRMAIVKSNYIITVSEFTKEQLILKFGKNVKSIKVIYNGVDHSQFNTNYTFEQIDSAKKKYGIEGKYILYLGNIKPHKNLNTLLQAFANVDNLIKEKLVIAGEKDKFLGRYTEFYKLYNDFPENIKQKIIFTGFIADCDLAPLLNGAELFVFPSLYEGFGLPPLEAMACGCATIVSNVTSMPEVCGESSYYFDPYNIISIQNAIVKMLTNSDLKNFYIKKGLKHAAKYDWNKAGQQHISLMNNLIKE